MGNIREKIRAGQPVLGTFAVMNSTAAYEILANLGLDFLVIDQEHGLAGTESIGAMVACAKATPAASIVRVPDNDPVMVKRALDTGAQGVMIPMVSSAAEAEKAVRACLYPPAGIRGLGAGYASLYGVNLAAYQTTANDQVLKIIQIEQIEAVNNIDSILAVPGIDVAFIGPTDLASSMGLTGQLQHPDLLAAIAKVEAAAKQHGVPLGLFCFSPQEAGAALQKGYRFVSVGLDSGFLATAVMQSFQPLAEMLNGTAKG